MWLWTVQNFTIAALKIDASLSRHSFIGITISNWHGLSCLHYWRIQNTTSTLAAALIQTWRHAVGHEDTIVSKAIAAQK